MENDSLLFESNSEEETRRFGAALAAALPGGANVALIGTLGAGKTRLVQAVGAALGVPDGDVTSPTFVLVNEYRGRRPVVHLDVYRLRDEDELQELGVEEYFESSAIVFVEWADRFADFMPRDRIEIRIDSVSETARRFTVSSPTDRHRATIRRLREQLEAK